MSSVNAIGRVVDVPADAAAAVPPGSAVSWPAIIAGALAAAGITVILVALGSGLGLASASPWPERGASAATVTVAAAIWLLVTQWLAAGLGGYLAGRLRSRWAGTHVHEVFFRDTAHGLVTWALATVLLGMVFAGSASRLAPIPSVATQAVSDAAARYDVDKLFRGPAATSPTGGADAPSAGARGQALAVLINAAAAGSMPAGDRAYLAQLVAAQADVAPGEAQRRVDELVASLESARANLRMEADTARKAAAAASLYLALSLLVGAFIASVAAALGGRERDRHG